MSEEKDQAEKAALVRISEIMIPLEDYPQVSPETTLHDAIQKMVESTLVVKGVASLPRVLLVIDSSGKLKGTVRRRDIMRGLEPKFLVSQPLKYRKKLFDVSVDPNLSELNYDKLVKGVREQASLPVGKVMRPINVFLEHDDHVIKGVYECVGYGLTLLPVLKDNRVVGVVRTVELFRQLARIAL